MWARARSGLVAFGAIAAVVVVTIVGSGASSAGGDDPLRCDFNGDGYADLAVGVPGEDVSGTRNAGAVNVIYGSADGLTADGDEIVHQGSPGVPGKLDIDSFGGYLACGDVDGDGYADLVVGTPEENFASKVDPGTMHVFPGSATGLDLGASSTVHRDTPGVPGSPRRFEQWGRDFALGDVNGDGYDDLVVASLHLDEAYVFIPGSATGLDTSETQRITEPADEAADEWKLIALADFTGDEFDDLVLVGAPPIDGPGTDVVTRHLFVPGTAAGPDWDARSDFAFRANDGRCCLRLPDAAVVATDVDDDGDADLVTQEAGYLLVARGTPTGIDNVRTYLDVAASGIAYAEALVAADIDGDDRDELILGEPSLDDGAGVMVVIPATPTGHTTSGMQRWSQDSGTVIGTSERNDGFGRIVHASDFDGDGYADVAVGVYGEGLTGAPNAGAVNVLYGSGSGLTGAGNQFWHQGRPGIAGTPEDGDIFGWLPD